MAAALRAGYTQDTQGAAFHPALRLGPGVIKVTKGAALDRDQNSAFDGTGLAVDLRRRRVKRVWAGGLAQDVCVRATVLDGAREGFEVHLIREATRLVNPDAGDRALEEMQSAGATLE